MENLNNNEEGNISSTLRRTGAGGYYYDDFHVCRELPIMEEMILKSMKLERDKKMI